MQMLNPEDTNRNYEPARAPGWENLSEEHMRETETNLNSRTGKERTDSEMDLYATAKKEDGTYQTRREWGDEAKKRTDFRVLTDLVPKEMDENKTAIENSRAYTQKIVELREKYPREEGESSDAYHDRVKALLAEENGNTKAEDDYFKSTFGMREQAARDEFEHRKNIIERENNGLTEDHKKNLLAFVERKFNQAVEGIRGENEERKNTVGDPEGEKRYHAWLEKLDEENTERLKGRKIRVTEFGEGVDKKTDTTVDAGKTEDAPVDVDKKEDAPVADIGELTKKLANKDLSFEDRKQVLSELEEIIAKEREKIEAEEKDKIEAEEKDVIEAEEKDAIEAEEKDTIETEEDDVTPEKKRRGSMEIIAGINKRLREITIGRFLEKRRLARLYRERERIRQKQQYRIDRHHTETGTGSDEGTTERNNIWRADDKMTDIWRHPEASAEESKGAKGESAPVVETGVEESTTPVDYLTDYIRSNFMDKVGEKGLRFMTSEEEIPREEIAEWLDTLTPEVRDEIAGFENTLGGSRMGSALRNVLNSRSVESE